MREERDKTIQELRQGNRGNYVNPGAAPVVEPVAVLSTGPELPLTNVTPLHAARRPSVQPRNTWDPAITVHSNRFSALSEDDACDTPMPGCPTTPTTLSRAPQPLMNRSFANPPPIPPPMPCVQQPTQSTNTPPRLPSPKPPSSSNSSRGTQSATRSVPQFPLAPPRRPLKVVNPYPERQSGMRVVPGDTARHMCIKC